MGLCVVGYGCMVVDMASGGVDISLGKCYDK